MPAIREYVPTPRVPLPPLDVWEVPHAQDRWIYIESRAAAHGEQGSVYSTFIVLLDAKDHVIGTTHFRSRIGRDGRRDTLPPGDAGE